MTSLQHKQRGFTIIELLIVIIVIGILATLVITTFSGIQRNARNRTREADINALHSQLEFYYGQNGRYPLLDNVNETGAGNAGWRATNLRGLDAGALSDPQDNSSGLLVAAPQAGAYAYAPAADGGGACDNATTDCAEYVLTATYEGGGTYVKNSLN